MSLFKSEDLFREFEKIHPDTIPVLTLQERFGMIIAALTLVLPYFFGIMGGLWLVVLLFRTFL